MSERLDCPISELPNHIRDYFAEEMDEISQDLTQRVTHLSEMGIDDSTRVDLKAALFEWNELRNQMISGSDVNFYDWNFARRELYLDLVNEIQFVKDCVSMAHCSQKGCLARKW